MYIPACTHGYFLGGAGVIGAFFLVGREHGFTDSELGFPKIGACCWALRYRVIIY